MFYGMKEKYELKARAPGGVSFGPRLIDDLSYSYLNGNTLNQVTDLFTDSEVIDKQDLLHLTGQ
jgi:hypothetical protein